MYIYLYLQKTIYNIILYLWASWCWAIYKIRQKINEFGWFIRMNPMIRPFYIMKFCRRKQLFNRIMIIHKNIIAVSTAYEQCRTHVDFRTYMGKYGNLSGEYLLQNW